MQSIEYLMQTVLTPSHDICGRILNSKIPKNQPQTNQKWFKNNNHVEYHAESYVESHVANCLQKVNSKIA